MDSLVTTFIGLGLIILFATWAPVLFRGSIVTPPMIAVAGGAFYFGLLQPDLSVRVYGHLGEILTEIALVLAIMGAGLNIDRRFAWRAWSSAWRLLALVMPLSILLITAFGMWILGLSTGMAVLLAGILTPTDPVLAADVQVGPPGNGEESEVRFALTTESALNDGLAFPVVTLGLLLTASDRGLDLTRWLVLDVAYKIVFAIVIGVALAILLLRLNRALPGRLRLRETGDGLVVIGITFFVYGLCQYAQAYGFIAVFCTAVTVRNFSDDLDYHRTLADFGEQIERLASIVVLVLFGGLVAQGGLSTLSWRALVFTLCVLFLARPLPTLLAFAGSPQPFRERLALGYLGIRGLGALYYSFHASRVLGDGADPLWPIVTLVVLASTVLFGMTSSPVLRALDIEAPDRKAA